MGGWDGVVGLVVAVGSGNNDLEFIAVITHVCCGGGVNAGAPERALVVGDGGRVWAVAAPADVSTVGGWVNGRVAFDVDVEGGAEISVIASSSAAADVVGGQGHVGKVRVGARGAVQVLEDLCVAGWGLRGQGIQRELRVGVEGRNGVWLHLRTGPSGLRRTSVLRVDETAVGASLWSSGASSARGARGSCALLES